MMSEFDTMHVFLFCIVFNDGFLLFDDTNIRSCFNQCRESFNFSTRPDRANVVAHWSYQIKLRNSVIYWVLSFSFSSQFKIFSLA